MGFLGFLKFALQCFHFLAWPLFAQGFPLYASIRAIEANSNSEMRNLVAYWILFSLISLFELAFGKLIDWLPFWPYVKLMAICWLVLPHFNGACYVYECLLRPYFLSPNPQVFINHFIKPKDDLPLNSESFLAVAEKYVQENGFEALEKLIDRKSKDTPPNIDMEEIKAVTNSEEEETAAAIQSKFKDLNVAKEDARAVELREKNPTVTTKWVEIAQENSKAGELKEKNPSPFVFGSFPVAAMEQPQVARLAIESRINLNSPPLQVEFVEPNLTQSEKKTIAAGQIKEKIVSATGGGNKVAEITNSEKVQREWTCALCQVITTSKEDLDSHLRGLKHKAKCEELKASKQVTKNKGCSSTAANQEPKKSISGGDKHKPNQNKTKNQEDKVKVNPITERFKHQEVKYIGGGMKQARLWCSVCGVGCHSETHMASHLRGKKHLCQIQQMVDSFGGGWDEPFFQIQQTMDPFGGGWDEPFFQIQQTTDSFGGGWEEPFFQIQGWDEAC